MDSEVKGIKNDRNYQTYKSRQRACARSKTTTIKIPKQNKSKILQGRFQFVRNRQNAFLDYPPDD